MSDHRPVFRVSPARRPLHQRFTVLAWVLIGLAVLSTASVLLAAGMACAARPRGEPWSPTAVPTSAPTPRPPTPTPPPTPWYQALVTPRLEATPAFPAWWSDQMTQDEQGRWWPPEEVVEMVRQHFQEREEAWLRTLASNPPDLDGFERELSLYLIGDELEREIGYLEGLRAGVNTVFWAEWEGGCYLQVQEWTQDGSECTVGQACSNGTAYDYDHEGQLHSEHRDHSGLILWRMRYDPTDGRWKIARFVEWIEPVEQ